MGGYKQQLILPSFIYLRRLPLLTTLVLQVLFILGACGTPNTKVATAPTSTPSPTPTPTLVPTPTPTPLPTAAPVAHVAGWDTLNSQHWVGYTFPQNNVTGLRAQWSEPSVTGTAGAEEFIWIGVGGWNYTENNIIQVGTFAYYPLTGGLNQGIWYQMVPVQQKAQFPLIGVSPGDQIFASLIQLQPPQDTWQISLTDVSTGVTFTKVAQFNSDNAYPAVVVEDPNLGPPGPSGPFYPFPHWGTVTFSNIQVRIGKAWVSAASLYAYRIQMARNGQVLATAGSLDVKSSFSATQG